MLLHFHIHLRLDYLRIEEIWTTRVFFCTWKFPISFFFLIFGTNFEARAAVLPINNG